jgi:hypothetical protein
LFALLKFCTAWTRLICSIELSALVACWSCRQVYLSMALQPFVGPWPLFQFLNPIHSPYDSMNGGQPVARPLPTHRTTQTQNKRTQYRPMPWVGFEPTIPASEREKAVNTLDCAATAIGSQVYRPLELSPIPIKNNR